MTGRKWFWLDWPPHKQQRFFKTSKWAWLLLLVASFGPLYFLTVSAEKQIERKKELYARVVPIATELRSSRLAQKERLDDDPQEILSRIAEKADIGWEHIRIDRQELEFDQQGVTVSLSQITLVELTTFLMEVRKASGLHFLEFTLERNPFNAMVADVTMTLVR